ncbi:MAG: hypothetical protein KGS72_28750 [Cyanobacteria bacterium REEB67]|nr:hypothetical protein [Cyanobacteria bacterium REEB67]
MAILTSNERVQRLEKLGLQALRNRFFAKAEVIFRDQLAILEDFRYTDEVALAIAQNNLGLALELQGKSRYADQSQSSVRANLHIAYEAAVQAPVGNQVSRLAV